MTRVAPRHRPASCVLLLFLAAFQCAVVAGSVRSTNLLAGGDRWILDHRYAPPLWQTSICLPDDWQKTLAGKDGALLYDYPGKIRGFGTQIHFDRGGTNSLHWIRQELLSPRIPIVRTFYQSGPVEIIEEAFAAAPPSSHPQSASASNSLPARTDLLLVRLRNTGSEAVQFQPQIVVETEKNLQLSPEHTQVQIGTGQLFLADPWEHTRQEKSRLNIEFHELELRPAEEKLLFYSMTHHSAAMLANAPGGSAPRTIAEAEIIRRHAIEFWQKADLPYDRFNVPDPAVQSLLDSAIRNIYQAREIKKGLPAFQVGPTCYRGLWVVDGSFIMEAIAYLGRLQEARHGIQYLISFQRGDGGFMLIDGHWKETGIALWAITRHARLSGDPEWLRQVWPKVERGFAFIHQMRALASQDAKAPNCGLIPDGFSDGGLADRVPEYTNIYWTMVGMRAAIEAARWLGQITEAEEWQREFDNFQQTFRRAAERDLKTDSHGHPYLPIRMAKGENIPPQKAQWAFLHAVFPGKLFDPADPLVRGNMAMLRAVESEGLVFDTGWLKDGIWNYFGSFYAHAWLWLGESEKAAQTLYAFGNHASPLLVWREEHKPALQGDQFVGDMPHNWASAEFIRLVRHCLVLERGSELHLLEALPPTWARPGAVTRIRDAATEFGPVSLELAVASDGSTANLLVNAARRPAPGKIVLHLGTWAGRHDTLELPKQSVILQRIALRPAEADRH